MVTLKTLDSVDAGVAIFFCTLAKDELLQSKEVDKRQQRIKHLDFIIDELSVEVLESNKIYPC